MDSWFSSSVVAIEEGYRQKRRQRSLMLLAWGTEFTQFLAALYFLPQGDLKNRMNCTLTIWRIGFIHPFLQIILVQNSLGGKEFNKFFPSNSSDDLCLPFCIYSSSMVVAHMVHATIPGIDPRSPKYKKDCLAGVVECVPCLTARMAGSPRSQMPSRSAHIAPTTAFQMSSLN